MTYASCNKRNQDVSSQVWHMRHATRETKMSAARYDICVIQQEKPKCQQPGMTYAPLNWQTKHGNQPLYWRCCHQPLRHSIYMFGVLISKPRSGGHHTNQIPNSLSPVNMDGHWISQHKFWWCVTCTIRCTSITLMWLFIRKAYAAHLSRSMFCGCHADHNCHNKHSVLVWHMLSRKLLLMGIT